MSRGIIGTGGHIDHGKTALVEALTGTRTDRLPEEQRRGITIDLGFAHLDLGGETAGVVDVPGHEDFIRNMVAGASGFDLLLLVVAADEGVMPQTREHVAIAEMLDVPAAVVALSKADLVEAEWLELAADDVATFLAGTRFADAPVIPTSATTGQGMDALRDALRDALPDARGRPDDVFRLPVDRVFSVRGTGTVVTGTVWSGRLRHDQHVRVLPGGRTARVRGLQVHGVDTDAVEAGQRAAVALVGLDREEVGRGATLVLDPAWDATRAVTAELAVLPASEWTIEHGQRLRVHLGTAEVMARAFFLHGQAGLAPGARGWATLRLEAPVVARNGDPLVIRSYSPVTTIGGGTVAEPAPPRRRRREEPDEAYLRALIQTGADARVQALVERGDVAGTHTASLPWIAGATPGDIEAALGRFGAITAGDRAFPDSAARAVESRLVDAVDAYHRQYPLRAGMETEALRRSAPPRSAEALLARALDGLVERGTLVMREGRAARPHFQPTLSPAQERLRDEVLAHLDRSACSPPRIDELRAELGEPADLGELIAFLEATGQVVRLEHDLFIHEAHIRRVRDDVRARFAGRSDLGPAEFRDVIPASRKHLIPILEYLDRVGVTTRGGNGRAVTAGRA